VKPADLVVTPMGLRFQGRVFPCSVGRGGIVAASASFETARKRGSATTFL